MRKKRTVLFFCLLMAVLSIKAQPFVKGTNVVSAGIGLGSSILHYSGASQSPAISLQYEKGLWDIGGPGVISLGGYLGMKGYKYSSKSGGYNYSEKWHYTVIGVRSAYHYNGIQSDKWDIYGGVMLSYNILNYKYNDNSPGGTYANSGSYGSNAGFSLYAGARYFVGKDLGILAELGYGVSYLNLGLALKF
jgi:hypothetical protein